MFVSVKVARWAEKGRDSSKNTMFFLKKIFKALEHLQNHFETILLNLPLAECEIQGKYTVVHFFYIATTIATVAYSQNMTKNGDHFQYIYKRYLVGRLLRHTQLDNCNHVGKVQSESPSQAHSFSL